MRNAETYSIVFPTSGSSRALAGSHTDLNQAVRPEICSWSTRNFGLEKPVT